MGRLSPITEAEVVQLHGANGPGLDEVGLAAWIAQAEPGEALVYHRGFLAVDATSVISKLPAVRLRRGRDPQRAEAARGHGHRLDRRHRRLGCLLHRHGGRRDRHARERLPDDP
nr:hypothetical protein [Rhodovulum sp. ES.010]